MELDKYIRDLQEELARKEEKLQHYEKELLRAERLEDELTAVRQKTMEQDEVIRTMERNQKKEEIKLDETVQKYNNTESEIVASVTVPAERGGKYGGKKS